jgi:CheY-like chemotaxis protein
MGIETPVRQDDQVPHTTAPSVLVVEDDEVGREALALVLRDEGFTVEEAVNGWQAHEQLRSGDRPDLILLDMMMPSLDGWHFLDTLRRDKALCRIPVIIVTALGVSCQMWARSLGAVACFRKPVDFKALLAEVRHWCG